MKKEDDEELYEDCLKRTLPELKMGKFTRESQYADGLIIEPKRYGVAGFKGRKRRAQNEKKILTKQEIMYDLYEKGLYTPEIWPVDLDIPTGWSQMGLNFTVKNMYFFEIKQEEMILKRIINYKVYMCTNILEI